MRGKGPHRPACCEVFAVGLRRQVEAGGLRLSVAGVRLLLRTKLPPHLVRAYPPAPEAPLDQGAVVVGFDPDMFGMEEEDEQGGPVVAAAAAHAGRDGNGEGGDVAMDTGDTVAAATSAAAVADDDDDGDDMDPRTLAQAAARLAHMTSDARVGPAPMQQWADVYKESGPDGVGAMGGEPTIDLAAWRLGGAAAGEGAGAHTLGGFYLARYTDSPVGAFDELVALAGLVWNAPTSCAWAARVYVNNREARDHGVHHVGLPSRLAAFSLISPAAAASGDAAGHARQQAGGSGRAGNWWLPEAAAPLAGQARAHATLPVLCTRGGMGRGPRAARGA
ncbi:hypothetical protein TSOC_010447, partial [Tetrabaena socialis]